MPLFVYSFLRGRVKGGNILYKICRFWADAFFLLIGIRHRNIFEEENVRGQEYIFVSNHISYLDIPMMMKAIRKQNVRILGKAELGKVPLFGFIYRQGVVSVERGNPVQRSKSIKNLLFFISQKISVFICPEGTFNTTHKPLKDFYNGAFRIAIETQKPIMPILFLDTYDRLSYENFFSLNPGRCRAVFLTQIKTEGMTMADVDLLKSYVFREMEVALVRYEASWIEKS